MDEGLAKIRHARSIKDFPFLKLEDDEYVEFAFSRAKAYLMMIFGSLAGGLALILVTFLVVLLSQENLDSVGRTALFLIMFVLIVVVVTVGLVVLALYRGNRLFVTNKRVIQLIMQTPVATSTNMIDLPSIEDASFRQDSIAQKMFHYGTFRLSTVGDETTYTFPYSDISPADIKAVSKLITEAKEKQKDKD